MAHLARRLADRLTTHFGSEHHHHHHHHHSPAHTGPVVGLDPSGELFPGGGPPGTYPRICRLSRGILLLSFTQFGPGGKQKVAVWRSSDGGRHFEPLSEMHSPRGKPDNMYLAELGAPAWEASGPGPVLAAFRDHQFDEQGNHVMFHISVCISRDLGSTWEYRSTAYSSPPIPGGGGGAWEPFLRVGQRRVNGVRQAGEVQLLFSNELAHDDQDTILRTSSDLGATWLPPRTLTGAGERLRDGMTGVAETIDLAGASGGGGDGAALAIVLETTRHGTFSVECLLSYDGGHSYGSRQTVYVPPRGRNAGAPQIASFADGALAVVFMTDADVPEQGWPERSAIKIAFAHAPRNGRIRWSAPHTLCGDHGHWPGIVRLDNSSVLAMYEEAGHVKGKLVQRGFLETLPVQDAN